MVFGMCLTILMQSSSVTASTLTPCVGIGLSRIEKTFSFTIGANIGTTVTGVLAALASSNMRVGFQVAMAHLIFNVFGTLMWFMAGRLLVASTFGMGIRMVHSLVLVIAVPNCQWANTITFASSTLGCLGDDKPHVDRSPLHDAYRYMDWLLLVPLLLIEIPVV